MKNIRKFEMLTEKIEAIIEEYSISYVNEENKVYTTPENGGQGGVDYSTMYTTLEALEDGTFSFKKNYISDVIQYSKDNGATWTPLASGKSVSVVTGDKVMWKSTIAPVSSYGIGTFSTSNKFNVSGNIMSLLYGDDFNGQTSLESKDYSCESLFSGCTQLIDAYELCLPATTLTSYCYRYMFKGCTSLTSAPELPATTLTKECYNGMFKGCTSLTTAPELPATTLADHCYTEMFSSCSNLTIAPELPATTLNSYCYRYMFEKCTSLTSAPELPATTLADRCYFAMFSGCTSLTTAPELPATILVDYCYMEMFEGCTSLTTAPELPATTLADSCYGYMFNGCESLTTAPELPATTLADSCYWGMFRSCTSLTTAPELPATTLAKSCYSNMFQGCEILTTAPSILPATTLADECYMYMFSNCTSLNHITMMATDISAKYCLSGWVSGVASTGTFLKHPDMTSLPTGSSGIPYNWTVEDAVL